MKINQLPKEFTEALPVVKKIEAAGFEAFFVGGSVRDVLLGKQIHDVDIATSAFPAEIQAIFPRTIDVGIQHGTVLVLADSGQYEITTFRTESTYQDFRRPDQVTFVRSLAEDLKRRDFTINAFALKEDGEIIDLFEGLVDMENHILRAVGNPHARFNEDALRMMRGLRFVSQLDFQLEAETLAAIHENHALLEKISVERIYVEFGQLLQGKARNQAIKLLVETECYLYCPQLRDYGAELLAFADLPAKRLTDPVQAWTLLISQLNLPNNGVKPFLKAWKASNELIASVRQVYAGLQKRLAGNFDIRDLYHLGWERAQLMEGLVDYFAQTPQVEQLQEAYDGLAIHALTDLAINGHDLLQTFPRKPGKWVKETLAYCEEQVVLGELSNQKADLLVAAGNFLTEKS